VLGFGTSCKLGVAMVRAAIDDFKVALQFLTRLPVRVREPWSEGALARSVAMFPLIGLLIGAAGALAFAIAIWLGLPPALAAVLAVAVQVLLSGGLHEDGLADLADGFGGGRTREEKLQIMRDSRLGSFGAVALILALLARIGAIAALAQPATVGAVLLAAGAISRAMMPPLMLWLAPARSDGLAAASGRPQPARVLTGLGLATLLALALLAPLRALSAILLAAGGVLGLAILARRQIGGHTGDVLGAAQQLAEIGCLLGALILRPAA
jgi:adenosylcobinamide-GDP ribazoletransferase